MLANTLGAVLVAILCYAVISTVARKVPAVLALEHPLTNLVYLIWPLQWLVALGNGGHSPRVALLVPLGCAGAVIVSALWHFRLHEVIGRKGACAAALGWFAIGQCVHIACQRYRLRRADHRSDLVPHPLRASAPNEKYTRAYAPLPARRGSSRSGGGHPGSSSTP